MNLNIRIHPLFGPTKSEQPWIYLGSDVQKYQRIVRWSTGTRIDISEFIQIEKRAILPDILEFLNEMSIANHHSIDWGITHLSGKNNLVSPFFLSVFQTSSLIKYLDINKDKIHELNVICEDPYIAETLFLSLKKFRFKISRNIINLFFRKIVFFSYFLLKFVYRFIKRLSIQISYSYFSFRSRSRSHISSELNEIYLIHLCLNDSRLLEKGTLKSNYYPELPDFLESIGKTVIRIPWVASTTLTVHQVIERLRRGGAWIPEDFLTICDILFSFWKSFKTSFSLLKKGKVANIDVTPLLNREFWIHLSGSPELEVFFRYLPALQKFIKKGSLIRSYNHFENMPFEKVIPDFFNQTVEWDFKQVGYHHTTVSSDFLGYNFYESETTSFSFPDLIVTNGIINSRLYSKNLISQGRVRLGPSLRQKFPDPIQKSDKKKQLLILLPLELNACIELLSLISSLELTINNFGINTLFRLHPIMTVKYLKAKLSKLNFSIPTTWLVSEKDLYSELYESQYVAVSASASIIDAILCDCIPIPVGRLLDLDLNGLDFCSDQYSLLQTIRPANLEETLVNLFATDPNEFSGQIKDIQRDLRSGLNSYSDELMNQFLI
ncbi:hypothetical protein [Leptospira levettii]|uniref:CDP-glycerol--glycerophosphate glycerophosphotransferase n=1 Tax=Leptospira levettii TaxID=2023178 RepID=A0AAW5VB69_9LEPT|nr:hypothetical protein [Leptospira levettii]MCW7466210.1 hypothetical protein [Leptospira levettii]MCW7512265.1 hypothetical protein [Leptospira levettii]MCW7516273.1 hypothetical protein [Leptospira levettii]